MEDEFELYLFTISGSEVALDSRLRVENGLYEFDLTDLNSGMYLLRVVNNDRIFTRNILLK